MTAFDAGPSDELEAAGGTGAGRLARLRYRASVSLGRWWRAGVAVAAILVALAAIGTTAAQVRRGWTERRLGARRALQEHVMDATEMLSDGVFQFVATTNALLMAPVLGADAHEGRAPVRLAALGRHVDRQFEALGVREDMRRGYLRLAVHGPWTLAATPERHGAMESAAFAEAVLAGLRERRARLLGMHGETMSAAIVVDGHPLHVLLARERDADGQVRAIVGLTFSRPLVYGRYAALVLEKLPLFPSTFRGIDWQTAMPAPERDVTVAGATGRSREAEEPGLLRTTVRPIDVQHNGRLIVRMTDLEGRVLFETPTAADSSAWRGAYNVQFDVPSAKLVLRAAFPGAWGDRLVEAAVPLTSEQRLLGGILVLALLFAAAAALELRRQRQLARARADFVSSVSHELRTPLAHISALSETLLLGDADSVDQERRWLRAIHREAQRLGAMVENVLLFARGERRRLRLDRQWVDVAELTREVASVAQPYATARGGARIAVHVPPACLAWVDSGALRQVLLNLLDNAVKYGPAGQTVTVTLETRALAHANLIVLTVDDEGAGIAPADRRRIWSPFVRLGDATGGGATGGSGLGLSVVRQLVGSHEGKVRVYTAPSGGARFVVSLPVGTPSASERDPGSMMRRGRAVRGAPARGEASAARR